MRYNGAATEARVEKNDSRNRPPMNAGIFGAIAVTTAPIHVPKHPMNIGRRRPRQSATQLKSAPAI